MARIDDLRIDESAAATRDGRPSSRRRLLLGLLGVLAVVTVALVWRQAGAGGEEAAGSPPPGEAAAAAAPAGARAVAGRGGITAGGYVEIIPPGPTVVAARVAGWVQSIAVIEGATVTAGQQLATLDATVHRQALAEAEAEVALAEARLQRLRAGFRDEEIAEAAARRQQAATAATYAASEVARLEQLVEIGAAAERDLLAAGARLAAAEAELAGAEALVALRRAGSRPEDLAIAAAELAQAETRRERLRWQVEQCVVLAPQAGVVLEHFVRVGDWIDPSAGGAEQGALLTLFDPGDLQVWVDVNQRDAEQVAIGQPVELRTDAGRDRPLAGRVSRIMPRANLQRNTVEVKIEILDEESEDPAAARWLRPEMSVQVTFLEPTGTGTPAPQPEGDRP